MGPKKAKKGGPAQSPGEDMKAGEKMSELDKESYLIQIKSLGKTQGQCQEIVDPYFSVNKLFLDLYGQPKTRY